MLLKKKITTEHNFLNLILEQDFNMKIKNIISIITFVFFLLINTSFYSSAYSEQKIAVLDVMKLLKESKAAISYKEQLNKIAKKYTEEEKAKASEIQKKEEELLRQKATLTPEAFSDRKNAFEKTVIDFNRSRDSKRKALSKGEREAVGKIEVAVEKIVQEMISSGEITIVIRKSAVILSKDDIDITTQVVEKLNKEISTIDVKVSP
tara:strand:- start:184 stop:804 length:621 start_codon:yes stop_codon:yes gene_type:complete